MYWWFVILTFAAGWSCKIIYDRLSTFVKSKLVYLDEDGNILGDLNTELPPVETTFKIGNKEITSQELCDYYNIANYMNETLAIWLVASQKGEMKEVDPNLNKDEWLDTAYLIAKAVMDYKEK